MQNAFLQSPSYQRLKLLSERPIDLTSPGVMTPERVEEMSLSAEGFHLLYGGERVTPHLLEELSLLAQEQKVVEKMGAMQRGEILNEIEGYPSEKRAVLHTAMRGFFSPPQAPVPTEKAAAELEKLERFFAKHCHRFTDIIQIGIGGSDLGPRALALAMEPFYRPGCRAHFISNIDPDDANRVLAHVDLKKSLIVVVSKSGTTLETLTNEEFLRARLKKIGLSPKEHFVAVTGEKSPMDNQANYLASFYMWDYVGGRYSATSMVGGVLLSFLLGVEGFREILRGAHAMDCHALTEEPLKNLPLLSALLGLWNRNFLHYPTVAIIPYSQALLRFTAHLQQLDMESNGKRVDRQGIPCAFSTGPVIWGEPGTNGQHSFYQLIHQGTDPVPLEFIGFQKSQYPADLEVEGTISQEKLLANLFAQSIALSTGQKSDNPNRAFPGNRPNRILLGERLTPRTLGSLLAFYEHKVAFQGFLWGINSFDQEGVQLGKRLATEVLSLFRAKRRHEPPPLFPLAESYLRFLSFEKK